MSLCDAACLLRAEHHNTQMLAIAICGALAPFVGALIGWLLWREQ